MKFIIIEITNENDALEANVSASDEGLRPTKPSCHLILGPAPRDGAVMTSHEALRRIGFAVADQLKDEEELIRTEAAGVQAMLLGLEEDGQIILRFDIGVKKEAAVDALIDGGMERKRVEGVAGG